MSVQVRNQQIIEPADSLRLLVVDDEPGIVTLVLEALANEKYQLITAFSVAEAKSIIHRENIDILLSDLMLGDGSGTEIYKEVQTIHPDCQTIFMTGKPSVNNAISLMKSGARDYITKPFNLETLKVTLRRTEEKIRLERENIRLRELMSFSRISEAMATSTELDKILNLILDNAIKEFKADSAMIFLQNEETKILENKASAGINNDSILETIISHCYENSVQSIKTSTPIIYNDPEPDYASDEISLKSSISQLLMAKGQIVGSIAVVKTIDPHPFTRGQLAGLGLLASKASGAIENSKLYADLRQTYVSTVEALANAIEARDSYTRGHTERVYKILIIIAEELGWGADKLGDLKIGGLLHDIGKIGVPDSILNKPGPLTAKEITIMKKHPELGARMIEAIPFLKQAIPYIISHHERYDGTGYPKGLKKNEIPYPGRLLAVVDTIDAVTSDRPYRKGMSLENAINEIKNASGTQFHPEVVDACVSAYDKHLLDFLTEKHKS